MAIPYKLDRISYCLGMITSFIEMVACGVKPLAISPPIEPCHLSIVEAASREISIGFGTKYCVVESLLVTDIQSEEFTKGKNSILYYADDAVIDSYFALQKRVDELIAQDSYIGRERRDIAIEFGRLLGYQEENIFARVDSKTRVVPFELKW